MMNSRRLYNWMVISMTLMTTLGCDNGAYHTTNARIVERREAGDGKIRLSYIFKVGQTTIAGVKIVDNVIIPTDSCQVKYKTSNPLENNLKLP